MILTRRGISLSLSTILRCRPQLGWTFCGSAYCQVIHEANKAKRLEWARKNLDNDFGDVVFTDECSIQTETHRRFSSRKRGEPPEEQAQVYMLRRFTNMYKPPVFNIVFCQLVIACTCFFFTFRPKHPVKVHVWAGISMRGRTGICILELWMLLCTQTFLKQPCFRSSMTPTQTVTSLCRIMITKYGLASQQLCNCCRRLLCNCFSSEHFVHCA